MPWPIEQLAKEWAVIKQAPLSFVLVFLLCLVVAFFVLKYFYDESIRHKNELIASLQARLELNLSSTEVPQGSPEPVKPQLLDPDLKLVNKHFAIVGKWGGRYFLVGKDYGATVSMAVCLDFSLIPVPHSVPWVEVRALIIFKNEKNQIWRVNDGIWLGRDSVKVPINRGETQTLILGTFARGEQSPEFSTYEHRPDHDPLERDVNGSLILVHVTLIGEYMNEVVLTAPWWLQLSGDAIALITQEQFEETRVRP